MLNTPFVIMNFKQSIGLYRDIQIIFNLSFLFIFLHIFDKFKFLIL